MKEKEIAKDLGYSSSTLQRRETDMKMQSPYKSNNPKRHSKTSNDHKKPQMTSKESITNRRTNLRAGDPSDKPSFGCNHFEQGFSD